MSLIIEPREKYLLITFCNETISQSDLNQLEKFISSARKESYIVLDFYKIKIADKEMLVSTEQLLQQIIKEDGLIVFANNDEKINSDLAATFNDPDLLILPTVDEAVDYIFMDEIENEIGGEG